MRIWLGVLLAGIVVSCTAPRKAAVDKETGEAQKAVVSEEKKKEFEYLFIEALKQKMVGNPQRAVSLLSACLEIDPRSSAAMYELANLHLMNNDLTSASLLLDKAIAVNSGNKWYQLLLARIYQQMGKNAEAALLFDQLARLEPDREEYLYMKAMELAKAGKTDEALRTFSELEKKTGLNDQISMTKQEILLEAGRVKEAFEEIRRLIASNPADPRYYGVLADLYKDQGDKENALRNYLKVQELDPGNGFVNFSLASFYLADGDSAKAWEYTLRGFESDGVDLETKLQLYLLHTGPNAEMPLSAEQNETLIHLLAKKYEGDYRIYSIYAEYLIRHDRNREARDQLLKVLAGGMTDFAIWEQLLFLDNDLQDWQGLYEHGGQALELFPNQAQFYFLRAIGALQLTKYQDAVTLVEEGLNYVVDNKFLQGQMVFLHGEALYKLDRQEEAFALFDQALALDPENYIAMNNYAYYLSLANRDLEKAERLSGRVIERFPDNATYLDTYAWVLFKKKNYALARFYMETALSHSEEQNATLIEHYGDILIMLGLTEEALVQWQKALDLGSESKLLRQKISEKRYLEE
ncbi:MAG: tetratricopeptide repeat protein [Prolixibacteraceae bacterium]|nr:tetratricopeptide repeat protein [Prolixibacteraceae bacterium]HNQ37570.1 tetratricopeptide repeat protein [Prolixibacteraceae bacterium]